MKTQFLLIATFVLGTTFAASAQEDTKAAKKVEQGADKTGHAVKSGAKKTGNAVESGAKKTGNAVEKGAKKTGNAAKKGANEVVEHTPGTDANKEHKAKKED